MSDVLVLMGFALGAVTALFFMSFGMFVQRKIGRTDSEDGDKP